MVITQGASVALSCCKVSLNPFPVVLHSLKNSKNM
jgi:hypothetical protein